MTILNESHIEPQGRDVACNVSTITDGQSVSTTTEPSEKFKNKYRIQSARLQGYDYSSNGAYFITICTKNREHFFGEIADEKMQLSEMGKIANDCWDQIPQHFSFVQLGEFVIMPNHVHGILNIEENDDPIVETPNLGVIINQYKRIQASMQPVYYIPNSLGVSLKCIEPIRCFNIT